MENLVKNLDVSLVSLFIFTLIFIPTLLAMLSAPFVPTPMAQVRRMLKAAKIKKGMVLYDLGAGDGRLVHLAAKEYGAIATGYEYSPIIWAWAKFIQAFWRSGAKIKFRNIWHVDLSKADVIVCYLLPHAMKRMEKDLLPQLKPGTIIVSHAFQFPGLKPVASLPRKRAQKLGPVWIYKIAAPKRSAKKSRSKKS